MKKVTNEDVAKLIQDCALEVNEEIENRLYVAQTHFARVEKRLIDSFTPEQKELFNEYNTEKQNLLDAFIERHKFLNDK